MCSISGFTWEDKDLIRRMTEVISYRGPDDQGFYTDKGVSLGHNRLSIVDLSKAGHQPMQTKDNDLTIIFNGEIYNHKDLRSILEKKYDFASSSDTEVLLYGFKEWGVSLLPKLKGMFAFAIWDGSTLFLARDRIGIKPLYYHLSDKGLIFASEMKSLLEYPIPKNVDLAALSSYLNYRFIASEHTMLKGIKKLLPGHYLTFKHGSLDIRRYWDMSFPVEDHPEDYFVKKFRRVMMDSVDRHLMSDVPLGAYLSGGLDSSLVVALNAKLRDDPVKTFTVGFGHETDEFIHARSVAEHLGTDHHELVMDYRDMTKALPKILWYMDEPNSDITMLPLYFLSQFSRKEVTVVNTGEGADELFSGYQHFRVGSGSFRFVPGLIKRNVYSLYYSPFKPWERKGLLKDGFVSDDVLKRVLSSKEPKDLLNRILLFDIRHELPNWQLTRVDRMTMAHAQEARVPFLDNDVIDFSGTVPISLKLKSLDGKYLIKKAASGLLPQSIIHRDKQGFTTPRNEWLRQDFMEVAEDILSEEQVRSRGLFNPSYVQKLISKVRKTDDRPFRPYSYKLLILSMFELWQRMYLDGTAPEKIL